MAIHANADSLRLLSTVITAVVLPFTAIAIQLSRKPKEISAAHRLMLAVGITISSAGLFFTIVSWGALACQLGFKICQ